MFWFLLFGSIGLIITIFMTVIARQDRWSSAPGTFIGGLCITVLFGALLGVLANLAASDAVGVYWVLDHNEPLKNLSNSQQWHGSFFLGSGSIGSTPTFFYYSKVDGYYKFDSVNADEANISEDNTPPHIEYLNAKSKNQFWALDGFSPQEDKQVFHIPPGSIEQNFTLGAPK